MGQLIASRRRAVAAMTDETSKLEELWPPRIPT